jgi:hypothetical protein
MSADVDAVSDGQRLTRSMRKRQRTGSDGETEDIPSVLDQNFTRHSSLWLDDGNIIIAANGVGFRVHKSVLAAKSPVMKDLFSLPQPADAEKIESCDVVHLEDDPLELVIFLNLFYNISKCVLLVESLRLLYKPHCAVAILCRIVSLVGKK